MTDSYALGKITSILACLGSTDAEKAVKLIAATIAENDKAHAAELADMEARFEASSRALGVVIDNFTSQRA